MLNKQIKHPTSAGSRGLAKAEDFMDAPTQIMKANDVVEDENKEVERIKKLAGV